MFFSSIVTYLFVRRCSLLKIPIIYQNFAFFVIPTIVFLTTSFIQHESLVVTWYQFIVLVATAIFFSYFGNVFSLRSLEYAPNPGYSLVISKSYVVFTTLVAILLFGSAVTLKSVTGIVMIIAFSSLILIGKPRHDQSHVRDSWLLYAVGSFFAWGMLAIISKYLLEIGVSVFARLIYVMGIVTVISAVDLYRSKAVRMKLTTDRILPLFIAGLFSATFNYFQQLGYALAPNIGYINVMNAASIAFVTIGASIFFKDEFNARKFIGVIGVIAGLMLLVI